MNKNTGDRAAFGLRLEEYLKDALAWQNSELALTVPLVESFPAERVKQIRTAVVKSPKAFERRFGIPARTVEGWEQGRRIDAAGGALPRVVEKMPEAAEKASREL